jgi:phage terminase large subunit
MIEMIKLTIKDRIFNKIYKKYMYENRRYQLYFGGSSSGKSYFLAQRCIIDVARGGRNYMICRNTATTIKKSVFNEICKAISFFKLDKCFSINKSDLVITCINGYQILFVGLDDTEKIKSTTPAKGVLTDIWIEEATETEYKKFKQLDKRLRGVSKHPKRLILSFNPILKSHWIYKEFFSNWDDTKQEYKGENVSILKTTYKDNKFLTHDDVKSLESETDKYYYEVYTLGNWGVLGAVIFKNWSTEDLSEYIPTFDKLKVGLDFGFSQDPAAMPVTYYDKKKKTIYIFDELYELELTNDVLAREVKKRIGSEYVVCDSSEPKSIKELKQYDVRALPAKKGKDSVNHGIQWLQQQNIIVHISCTNMINELSQYKWKEDKDGNVLKVPVDKNNHLIDALRYAYEDEMVENRWGW